MQLTIASVPWTRAYTIRAIVPTCVARWSSSTASGIWPRHNATAPPARPHPPFSRSIALQQLESSWRAARHRNGSVAFATLAGVDDVPSSDRESRAATGASGGEAQWAGYTTELCVEPDGQAHVHVEMLGATPEPPTTSGDLTQEEQRQRLVHGPQAQTTYAGEESDSPHVQSAAELDKIRRMERSYEEGEEVMRVTMTSRATVTASNGLFDIDVDEEEVKFQLEQNAAGPLLDEAEFFDHVRDEGEVPRAAQEETSKVAKPEDEEGAI